MRVISTDPDATRALPSAADREMLRWAVKWLPFETGDEYIFPDFGVTPAVFYHRIAMLISTGAANHIEPGLRMRLRKHCSDRITRLKDAERIASLVG
ncbi:DUF3263 domain-containing protein [Gordonia terrae]